MLAADCSEVAGARLSTYGMRGRCQRVEERKMQVCRALYRSRRGQALRL